MNRELAGQGQLVSPGGLMEAGTPFGHYQLRALIGRGSMGEVWRAFDTRTNREVALKVLPEHFARNEMFQQRFRRDAQAVAKLNDPHLVPIHGYGEIDRRLYVDMRLIDGRDLSTIVGGNPLVPARAVAIVEQVAKALEAAHREGLVHLDVKPSNILVADFDFAYLIDFGVARAADETNLTGTGTAIGSRHYMAPERFENHNADPRSDTYALTCVLHECLTGRAPFPGDRLDVVVDAHLHAPTPRPSTRAGVPAAFDDVIAKGMAKNPDARYRSTIDLARAARKALTVPVAPQTVSQAIFSPTVARRPAPVPSLPPRSFPSFPGAVPPAARPPARRSKRGQAWALAIVFLLLVAGAAVGARFAIFSNYYVGAQAGAQTEMVVVLRGTPGSFLGYHLQEPHLVGCINDRGELSMAPFGEIDGTQRECRLLAVDDLQPAARDQVRAGLPSGSLDDAIGEIRQLVGSSLLPPCTAGTGTPLVDCRLVG